MKAEELRIGNWALLPNGNKYKIERSDFQHNPGLANLEDFKPVPLTEELLMGFGFKRDGNEFRTDWFLGISFDVVEKDFHVYEVRDSFHITTIKYVHQLQNLYFALTGEELIKK